MFQLNKFRYITRTAVLTHQIKNHRPFHEEFSNKIPKPHPAKQNDAKTTTAAAAAPLAVSSKYDIFKDEDASIIFDIEEEREKMDQQSKQDELQDEIYTGLNLNRGKEGVFDIEDLVEVLRKDNGMDIFVCNVDKQLKYVDYICIVTGQSLRHRKAMMQFVRKMFKLKRTSGDILPKIEGEHSKDWMAIDLGNIALHIFSPEARRHYDLESLWTVGSEFDKEYNKPNDELLDLYERHSIYLGDLTPNTKSNTTT